MIVTIIPNTGRGATAFENRIAPEFHLDFQDTDELYDFLLDNVVITEEKTKGHFIVPAEFIIDDYIYARRKDTGEIRYLANGEPAIRRCAENVRMVTMLPADYDDGMTIEEALERFAGLSFIIVTSHNHLHDGKTPKFHILFEIKEAVTPKQLQSRKEALYKFLGPTDKTTLYLSRGFYTPTLSSTNRNNFDMDIVEGKPLDVLSFDKIVPVPYVPSDEKMSDADMQEIKGMLQQSSVPSYERWWQMIQAMKSCGYSEYDVLDVSANNTLHESPSTGVKDSAMCSSTFLNVATTVGGMGKLIILIREGGHPDFRKAKKSIKQCELEAALEKFNELKIKRKLRKSK